MILLLPLAPPLASERQIPTFHNKAYIKFTPPLHRKPSKNVVLFDTSSVVHSRSSPLNTPDLLNEAFSLTLTTNALYKCRLGWFETNAWTPVSEDLPPSLLQPRGTHWLGQCTNQITNKLYGTSQLPWDTQLFICFLQLYFKYDYILVYRQRLNKR